MVDFISLIVTLTVNITFSGMNGLKLAINRLANCIKHVINIEIPFSSWKSQNELIISPFNTKLSDTSLRKL